MTKLLEKLINAVSPSGDEKLVRDIITKAIKPYVDKIEIDTLGNLICWKKGKGPNVVIAAHMDEVGLMVDKVDDDGYLKLSPIGGIDPISLVGQKVYIMDKRNKILCDGVITFEEIHNGEELFDNEIPTIEEMYVDSGLTKDRCKKKGIEVGSYVVPHHSFGFLGNNKVISGKALDDRIGCYILVELAKKLKNTTSDVHFIFTVQEEIGLYGAKTSLYTLEPDWGIAVDVINAQDGTVGNPRNLGAGPVITIKDAEMIANQKLNQKLIQIAEKHKISIQKEVSSGGTTDATNIMLSKGGIPSTVVGVYVRNIHSTIGIADLTDIQDTVNLLYHLLKNPIKHVYN